MANVIGIAPLQAPSFNGDISGNCGLLLGPQTTPTSNVYKISASSASGSTSITVSGNLDLTKLSSCSISGEGIQPDTTVISSTYNSPNTVLVLSNPTTSALTSVNTVNITEVENSNITFFSSASSSSDAQIVVTSNTSSENSGQLSIVSGSIKTTATTIDFTSGTTGVLVPTVDSSDNSEKAASTAYVNLNKIQKETVVITSTSDGQSTYTVPGGYTSDKIDVYLNGLYLVQNTDYTASDGSTIVLNDVLATEVLTNSTVTIVMYSSFSVSDTVSPSELSSALEPYVLSTGGTVSGSLTFTNGNIYVQGPSNGVSQLHLENGSIDSWTLQRDTSNNFSISRYDSTGTLVDSPLSVDSSTGIVNFTSTPTVPTPVLTDSSTKVATTEFVVKNKINRTINSITATTDGQTTFTVPNGYNVINIDVYLNGYYLIQGIDYTATDGTTIVLSSDLEVSVSTGDIVTVQTCSSVDVTNVINQSVLDDSLSKYLPLSGGDITGPITAPTVSTTDNSTNVATTAFVHNYLPIGTVVLWISNIIPVGWLLLDGSTFDQTQYTTLYSLLGSTTLPDMRGLFARGYDPTGNVDIDGTTRGLLSYQEGSYIFGDNKSAVTNVNNIDGSGIKQTIGWENPKTLFPENKIGVTYTGGSSFYVSNLNFTGITRPKNMSFNYIIKAV